MKIENNILGIILKYLRRVETLSERDILYKWYESLGKNAKKMEPSRIIRLHHIGKKRLFTEIGGELIMRKMINPYWYSVAAAILIVVGGYIGINFLVTSESLVAVQGKELAAIAPQAGKATITLSTGELISLDTLNDEKTAAFGEGTIIKDDSGTLSYKIRKGANTQNITGTLQTSRAAQYKIELSDGSKVWLNAKSKLSFPEQFGEGDRVVQLTGEAYFEVRKTPQKSRFIVKTNGQSIEVLGTRFNVNAYVPNVVKTTLAQGSVKVTPSNTTIKPVLLRPNQQTVLDADHIEQVVIDASRIIAWKDGYFSFNGSNTSEIITEISEWYGIPVEYHAPSKSIKYTGKIPKNISLERLIMLLGYQDMAVKAYKDKNNQLKLIVN